MDCGMSTNDLFRGSTKFHVQLLALQLKICLDLSQVVFGCSRVGKCQRCSSSVPLVCCEGVFIGKKALCSWQSGQSWLQIRSNGTGRV
ncbi:hypothetical protein BpHYR1_046669 [Brachionus plicatilis]|uniref:Uncharacterized protein n=1 Tax=Brachionus plicatilis TaxID=10195 RepID=A0A3M7RVJ4_BRAPC|nr:hypothetical protein BpHYR1_046669 [Brachionus plicatilis]